jgi:hypothetical protein
MSNRNLFFTILEAGQSTIKAVVGLMLGEARFPFPEGTWFFVFT